MNVNDTASERSDTNPANTSDPNLAILASFIELMKSGLIQIPGITVNATANTEEKRLADLDHNYPTPPFIVPIFKEKEKLKGYRNYRQWKSKFELSLETNRLTPFIESEDGDSINISPGYRKQLKARPRQTLQALVSDSIKS